MLYADDSALVSTSWKGPQAQLNTLQSYAAKWRLTVNIGKTKSVAFTGSRSSKVYPLQTVYGGANIAFVGSYR